MKTVYLINEIILFSPENGTLTPREGYPSGKMTLHGPASECLHILLKHVHQPVTQKALFEQVWQRKGVVVSTNTLYQSIASIRKGLKSVGLEEDIIRTLPKQGFQCNATIRSGTLEDFITPPSQPIISVLEENLTSEIGPLEMPSRPEKRAKSGVGIIASLLATLAIIATVIYWTHHTDIPLSIPYYAAGKIDHCTLYSSWSDEEYSRSVFQELQQRNPINCTKNHTAYLTVNRLQLGSSLMLCTDLLEQKGTKCHAYIFKDDDESK